MTKGSQPIIIGQTLIQLPVNEDFGMVGEIISYEAATGKISFKKVFDKAATPETFYAVARYQGKTGIPLATEVVAGSYAIFKRVGVGNVSFTGTQPAFQLDDDEATNKASFVSFFFPEEEE